LPGNWRVFAHGSRPFNADRFDEAIEQDANAGKLDAFANEALVAYRAGQARDL
jgi:hypothetical protein